MATPSEVLLSYLRAYEAKDVGAIRSMLAEDVRLQDWNLVAEGAVSVLAETQKNFEAAAQLRIEVLQCYEAGAMAAAELRITVNSSVVLEVVDAIHVGQDGRILSIRAYKG